MDCLSTELTDKCEAKERLDPVDPRIKTYQWIIGLLAPKTGLEKYTYHLTVGGWMGDDKTTVIDKVGELHFVVTVDYPEETEPEETEPEPKPVVPIQEKS